MSRLLANPLAGVYRDAVERAEPTRPFVVNGWIGDTITDHPNVLFAGVHLGRRADKMLTWIKRSPMLVGSRDPFTRKFLNDNGIENAMIGCATITFPRYAGPRAGWIAIDETVSQLTHMTNGIPIEMSWSDQWDSATKLLNVLRTSERVYTSRLHIALPCLAFGTPVVMRSHIRDYITQPERFSILDEWGFAWDRPFTMNVTEQAHTFMRFLEDNLKIEIRPLDARFPNVPGGDYDRQSLCYGEST